MIARHMFDLTGGAFDVSIGTGLPSLELDPDDFLVRATKSGVQVDLGGIGKGYAVDRMADVLEEWGLGMRSSTGDSVPSSHWSRRRAATAGR